MNPDARIEIKDKIPEKVLWYQDIPNWLYELKSAQQPNTRSHWQTPLFPYTVAPFRTKKDYPFENIKKFFGDNVNQHYLSYILDKYFPIEKNAGYMSTRKNKGILFEYWFENEMNYFNSLERIKNRHRD